MLHPDEVLALYDAEMRRNPVPYPGTRVEHIASIVRVVGEENTILFSDLTEANARSIIAEQAEFFRRAGTDAEWKTFGHDQPKELPALLEAAGFIPDAPETLVVCDLRTNAFGGAAPQGAEILRVTDEARLHDAQLANDAAFGRDAQPLASRFRDHLADPELGLFVAYVDGNPVATGRLEMPLGRSFASLWGGGTVPRYRRRGLYRGLVAVRAALARGHGYRFLTVDARESSLPILERLGFVPLTTTRGWLLRATPRNRASATGALTHGARR